MTPAESRAVFFDKLHQKLEQGAREHGDKSFDLTSNRLVEELQAEALDLAGWGWILWDRLERLRKGCMMMETRRRGITFDELVEYGKSHGGNIVNGMPWSFTYEGCTVTHENNDCYLINKPGVVEPLRFNRGDVLITSGQGELYLSTEI